MEFEKRKPSARTAWSAITALLATFALGFAASAGKPDLALPDGPVILEVSGKIERSNSPEGKALFDSAMLAQFPPHQLYTGTTVTDGINHFDGILMRDLLDHIGASGDIVRAIAHNDYVIDIPVEDFIEFDVILAHSMDGKKLSRRDKGPLWIVYPRDDHPELQDIRYDYRWVWQLRHIEVR